MPRKGFVPRREVPTDSVFGSDLVQKFINCMMYDGKRSNAQRIFYGAMDVLKLKGADRLLRPMFKSTQGDFRDWAAIEDWSRSIARELAPETAALGGVASNR